MVNDANLMNLILGKRTPLAFHPCNIYSTFSENRVVFAGLWGIFIFEGEVLRFSSKLACKPYFGKT